MKTLSQKTAIMRMENMTEEQAELEIERIKKEEEANMQKFADPSIFNEPNSAKKSIKDVDENDTSKHSEGNPVTDKAAEKPNRKTTRRRKTKTTE